MHNTTQLKRIGLSFLGLIAAFGLTLTVSSTVWAQSSQPAAKTAMKVEKPTNMKDSAEAKKMSVKFYADWCGSCKTMAPAYNAFKSTTASGDTLHVKFDLTSKETTHQSAMLATALGLSDLWEANGGKTGVLYVVDADSKSEVAKLTKTNTVEEMVAAAP